MRERRDTEKKGCRRGGVAGEEGFRTTERQEWRVCRRRGEIQERRDAGEWGFHERRNTGKEGCRKGGVAGEEG